MAIDPRPQRHKAARSRIYDPGSSAEAQVSPTGALRTAIPETLLEGDFSGVVLDTDVWTETIVGSGTNTIGLGVASLKTGAAASSAVKIVTVEQGIFTFGEAFQFSTGIYGNDPVDGNTRRWGVMDAAEVNGLFFEMSGGTFYVVSRRAGVDSKVEVTVFNHDKTFVPTTKNAAYSIRYTDDRAIFQVNFLDEVVTLHVMIDQEYSLIENYNLGVYFENTNDTNDTDVEMRIRGGSLSILGSVPLSKLASIPVDIQSTVEITFHTTAKITSVADNTRTTIVTQAFVAESFEALMKISASGSIAGIYYLQVDTGSGFVDIDTRRAIMNKTALFDFTSAPFSLSLGHSVRLQVEHRNTGKLEAFEGTIYGGV
ncbi:MAG: hypothetical protein JRJ45_00240 [Deltaproteobacteria bacterium]|nr:hypothetical protein [Deltaproteobacteria bacterium]